MGFTRQIVSGGLTGFPRPRLFRIWMEDPDEAVTWMPGDRFLTDSELQDAKAWSEVFQVCGMAAKPMSVVGEPPRVLEVFGPLGDRDDDMPPEVIIYPAEEGFIVESSDGGRVAAATVDEALKTIRQ
jgi:hypothetical protein